MMPRVGINLQDIRMEKTMKKLMGTALALGLACAAQAEIIAGYDFDDGTGTATTVVTVKDANVTASDYDTGTGLNTLTDTSGNSLADNLDAEGNVFGTANQISFGGAQSTFGFADQNNGNNLSGAISQNDYMTFTVTPLGGVAMNLASFTFRTRANQLNNSAERWALFTSVDGFTNGAQIVTGQTTDAGTWTGGSNYVVIDLSAEKFQELEEAIEFRLYIYGGNASGSSATLFDKVIVNGTVHGGANQAPTADEQSVRTFPDTPVDITLTGSDPEGSNLTYNVETQPTHGTLAGATHVWLYTPTSGYLGTDSFTFTVSDGETNSAPATVLITVTNELPVANALTTNTVMNVPVEIMLTGSDADGPSNLTYRVETQPTHGSLAGATNVWTYTPVTDYAGPDSFTFSVSDGLTSSAPATVSISVTNYPPVATNQSLSATVGSAVEITLTGSDVDGPGALSYTVETQPVYGSLTGTPPNLTYTPGTKVFGTDSFTFTVSDGLATSAPATVSISMSGLTGGSSVILAGYDFTGASADATMNAAHLTASAFTNVPPNSGFSDTVGDNSGIAYGTQLFGVAGAAADGAVTIPVSTTSAGSFDAAVSANAYFSFTVTPDDGFKINLTSLTFKAVKKASTSIDMYALADADGNQIGSSWQVPSVLGTLTGSFEANSIDLSDAAFQGLTEATEFRIYVWGRGTSSTSNTMALMDKVVLNGTVARIKTLSLIGITTN